MSEVTVDKIVVELDYEISKDAEDTISKYEDLAEKVKVSAEKIVKQRKKRGPSRGTENTASEYENMGKKAKAAAEKVAKQRKKMRASKDTEADSEYENAKPHVILEKLTGREQHLRSFKNAGNKKYEKQLNKLWDSSWENQGAKNIGKLRKELWKKGFYVGKMDDEEIFKTSMNLKKEEAGEKDEQREETKKKAEERKEEKRKKAEERMSAKRNREALNEEKRRTKIFSKMTRPFGLLARFGAGLWTARRVYGALTRFASTEGNLETTAAMSNMTTQRTQAVQEWFKVRNIDPEKGMKTLESYAKFTHNVHMPYDKILEKMIGQSRKGSLHAAVAHGADPRVILAMRKFKENIGGELNKLQTESFSDEELEKIEKMKAKINEWKRFWLNLDRAALALSNFEEKIQSFLQIFGLNKPENSEERELTEEENFVEHQRSNPVKYGNMPSAFMNRGYTEEHVKNAAASIVIHNHFNIGSTDPEKAVSEIQKNISSDFYKRLNLVKPTAVY
jgi:hypothetical protein